MDKYTATELAFKNGYEKGYAVGWASAPKRPITNADKFRAMTDMELAKFLMQAHDCELHIPFCKNKQECCYNLDDISDTMCMVCMMEWLSKEAE